VQRIIKCDIIRKEVSCAGGSAAEGALRMSHILVLGACWGTHVWRKMQQIRNSIPRRRVCHILRKHNCWTHLPHLEGGVNDCGDLFPKTSLLHKKYLVNIQHLIITHCFHL
jgi:hypothetical protein